MAALDQADRLPLDGPARFLETSETMNERVALASYPRCGNSLLRKLIEQATGVITGADTLPERTLSQALQRCGARGEGIVDGRVWVVKTHYPERKGFVELPVDRAILLVRNPWDAIDSYFNMALTNDHATSLRDDQYERFEDLWRELTAAEAGVWARFNRWWLQAPVPLLVVRYEDLVHHRHRTLRRVCWFLRGERELEGTPWAERVAAAAKLDDTRAGFYAPRNNGAAKLPGAALRRFDDAARRAVAAAAGSLLQDFGYGERFPTDASVAPRAVRRPVPQGDARHEVVGGRLVLNTGREVRPSGSKHGRYMTTFRKALREPVVAADGTALNMHEVEAARERWRRKRAAPRGAAN